MIKLSWIAELCLNLYYTGRAKEGKKLDFEDFDLLVQMANATMMRKAYYDMLDRAEAFEYYGYQLESVEYDLPVASRKGRRVLEFEENKGYMRLPKGMGIFNIEPVTDDDVIGKIRMLNPGTRSLYSGEDFEDVMFWENRGNKVYFYNIPACVTKVEVDGILNYQDMEVPMDLAIDIINLVLFNTLKTINQPIDKTNDGDPNLLNIKSRIAEKQGV